MKIIYSFIHKRHLFHWRLVGDSQPAVRAIDSVVWQNLTAIVANLHSHILNALRIRCFAAYRLIGGFPPPENMIEVGYAYRIYWLNE